LSPSACSSGLAPVYWSRALKSKTSPAPGPPSSVAVQRSCSRHRHGRHNRSSAFAQVWWVLRPAGASGSRQDEAGEGPGHFFDRRHLDLALTAHRVANRLADRADVCQNRLGWFEEQTGWESSQCLLKALDEFGQRYSNGPADLPKFQNVQPALTGLVLADERLRLLQPPSHIRLGQARPSADGSQRERSCSCGRTDELRA